MAKPYVLAGWVVDQPMGLDETVVLLAIGDHEEALENWLENSCWTKEGYLVFTSQAGNILLIRDPFIQYVH